MIELRKFIWAVLFAAVTAPVFPARGQPAQDSPPLPALPAPMPAPSSPTLPPPEEATSSIGSAEMDRNGTIRVHLRAAPRSVPQEGLRRAVPWASPEERIGYGEIELSPRDPYYNDLSRHLGGLRPGETKPVPPWRADEKWHCALDPDRGPCALQHLLPDHAPLP